MSDMTDRQAAIEALDRIFDRCEEIEAHLPKDDPDRTGYKMYPDYMTVLEYLHQLPSAEPERKRGKWISGAYLQDTEVKRYSAGLMYCSVCKHEAYSDTDYGEQLFDYCPYCGARMVGYE